MVDTMNNKSQFSRVISLFLFFFLSVQSSAHFNPVVNRSFHIVFDQQQSVQVYVRIPLPLLLITSGWGGVDSGEALPFTVRKYVEGQWRYYLDVETIENDWRGFTEFALNAYSINTIPSLNLLSYVDEINIHSEHFGRGFSTFQSATSVFDGLNNITLSNEEEIFDAVVDIYFEINNASSRRDFLIKSDQGINAGIENRLFNHVFFYDSSASSDPILLEIRHNIGLLKEGFYIRKPASEKFLTAVYHGIEHIVLGWDHLLFVILLVLVSNSTKQVVQRATVFTIGHSITLTLGVFGIVPSFGWFIPLIESLIASSILIAGFFILLEQSSKFNLKVCFTLGLVHGFGFSFVLNDGVFQQESIDYLNLLGINLGIEVGQVLIYLFTLPLVYLIQRYFSVNTIIMKKVVIIPCVFISGYWLVIRLLETSEYII